MIKLTDKYIEIFEYGCSNVANCKTNHVEVFGTATDGYYVELSRLQRYTSSGGALNPEGSYVLFGGKYIDTTGRIITDNSIEQIMQKISPESYNKITKNPISMTNWIISGIITILLLCASVIFASKFNSSTLTFIYTLISGTAIITYCCAFVISNIDFFIKKISFIR